MAEFEEVKTPDMNEPHTGPGLPPAVPRLFMALVGGLAVLALPYGLTPLAAQISGDPALAKAISEYRVWWPGDPVPFSEAFQGPKKDTEKAVVSGTKTGADGELDIADIEAPTVDPVEDAGAPGAADGETDDGPAVAQAPPHPWARIHVPESIWEDLKASIEDPHGVLAPAWEKLAKVALREPGQVFRLSHFGDSAIAADGMPSSTRRYLQRFFGDAGHGYSLVSASNNWYRRKDVEWTSRGFTSEVYISDEAKDRRYGYGGTASTGGMGARATWKTIAPRSGEDADKVSGSRVSRVVVYHHASPRGGKVSVWVDGAEHTVIDTAAEVAEDRATTVSLEDGPHTVELRVSGGRVRLYGVALERERGVVVDGLGTIGARDTRWQNVDPEHLEWAFGARDADLAAFMYGGNQLEDKVSMEAYKSRLSDTVRLWKRGLKDRACLLISPIDHGERYRGRVRTVPRQHDIMRVQREVALAEGCAWFSLYDAMGGEGSIGDWFKQGLAEGDLAHPTAKGALALGRIFFQALMKSFSEHLSRGLAEHKGEAPALKEAAPKDTAPKDTAPKVPAPKETAPKDTAPKDTAPKVPAP